jgi:hypothetical protein
MQRRRTAYQQLQAEDRMTIASLKQQGSSALAMASSSSARSALALSADSM